MKKLLAIILLIVHLFNLMGYSFLFGHLINQSARQIAVEIDNHIYNDSELIEIKVPVEMPYITAWGEYERYDGEISINNKHHHYVKRKVANDTLYLLCLPNKKTDDLQMARNEYSQKANDFDGKDNNTIKKSGIFYQYCQDNSDYTLIAPKKILFTPASSLTPALCNSFAGEHGKPPESNS